MKEERKSIWNPAFDMSAGAAKTGKVLGRQSFRNPWGEPGSPAGRRQSGFQQLATTFEEGQGEEERARRRSSLIVPPTRAAGPEPLLRETYGDSWGYGSEFQRRQSVAVAGTYHSPGYFETGAQQPSTSPSLMVAHAVPYRKLSAYPPLAGALVPAASLNSTLRGSAGGVAAAVPQMRKVGARQELAPVLHAMPKFRRASLNSKTVSPLIALTKSLIITYSLCSDEFSYQTSKNPKRLLTKPSEGKLNNGHDNINSDYILYVNDVLGMEQQRKYLILDILGQGTFGQVVKCQNMQTKEIVAVKVVKSKTEYLNQSIMEAKILELLNKRIDPLNQHHFLRLHDSFVHKNHLCLVFELLSNNLYELLKQNKFHGLSMNLIKNFCKQLLDSLCVLKESKLIHCDLKPENVLLVSPDRPELKVIDFGSACEEARTVYTYIQSRFYRAPEVLMGIPYSTSIDMWSFGCIVAELFLGIPVFPGASEFNQMTRIVEMLGVPPPWMCEMGKNTYNFFRKLHPQEKAWALKTVDEYNVEFNASEEVGKQYFKWTKLDDVIRNYRISKKIGASSQLLEREMQDRQCLTHFLFGVLNLNPLERWTPQQALLHPFITGQPFDKEWYPPGTLPKKVNKLPSLQDGATKELNKLHLGE
ncbi:ACR249Cp [Eremothecium gossypii ATCC 10895]|uniref:ACR249Cp n=1 Tax=Eremothecium gossypii (strain ATCC 10895 / CBS 109.51 / FGSC 9923 / NRRL Y-1056) TaxID=284811 RepID=Q75BM2_EREGS|nr:ACR249Cp [Eremothecium gossypii ATCC 10895]AAS51475.1 ACR249Cp [Eremothecium gossypii ATCC 10895]AEY95767.1 FACR249Cp [Eremothecium gossypii FDAG1]